MRFLGFKFTHNILAAEGSAPDPWGAKALPKPLYLFEGAVSRQRKGKENKGRMGGEDKGKGRKGKGRVEGKKEKGGRDGREEIEGRVLLPTFRPWRMVVIN